MLFLAFTRRLLAVMVFVCFWSTLPAIAGDLGVPRSYDWPQWQGPDRTGVSREKGLLQSWPKGGPKLLWRSENRGGGYSTPSVAAGRIFGMGYRDKNEVVWALNEATGEELWSTTLGKIREGVGYNEGPRCTPTVDGSLLYVVGVGGDVACLNVADGKIVWRKSLTSDFGGKVPHWGYSESPLIDGDRVLCTPGGKKATLVALDKKTGAVVWKGIVPEGDEANYSSIIEAEACGQRTFIQFLRGGVVGMGADGKFLWRYNHPANGTANISTPVFHDDYVFAASSYGTGGGLAKLSPDGSGLKAEEVYFTKSMKNHHGGMVLIDGYIYGSDEGKLTCLDFKTGKVKWAEGKAGKGSITAADGRLYYRNEAGPIILVEINPEKYVEAGRFEQPDRSGKNAWPHPVVANGRLYILDQGLLLCYDVKK